MGRLGRLFGLSVIAAAAVATKDCDEFGVYAGIPARKIKERKCK